MNDPLQIAEKIALRSPQQTYKTGCVIVKRKEVISDGWSHVLNLRYSRLRSIHAEMHALARARHITPFAAFPTIAYVATVSGKSWNTTTGKPCLHCAIALKAAGVDIVVFTMPDKNNDVIDLHKAFDDLEIYRKPA